MEFAPDGRIFVAEQGGDVRIVEDGQVRPDPFLHLDVYNVGERGLLGLTLDPNFAANGYVYLYYTAASQPVRNRVVRVTAEGDHAAPGSLAPLLNLQPIDARRFFHHVGGAMHFGPDGKLYVTTGDLGLPSNSQSLKNPSGKVLRINSDGSIPADNPFSRRLKGINRAIWAYGFRNPFTFAVDRATGRILVNDVGFATFEEVDTLRPGVNYGWPNSEGFRNAKGLGRPLFAYRHGTAPAQGCAITGGAFYSPTVGRFPNSYTGAYFFGDYCNGWIHSLDPTTGKVAPFADHLGSRPIDIDVDDAGDLYYLGRGNNQGGRRLDVQDRIRPQRAAGRRAGSLRRGGDGRRPRRVPRERVRHFAVLVPVAEERGGPPRRDRLRLGRRGRSGRRRGQVPGRGLERLRGRGQPRGNPPRHDPRSPPPPRSNRRARGKRFGWATSWPTPAPQATPRTATSPPRRSPGGWTWTTTASCTRSSCPPAA